MKVEIVGEPKEIAALVLAVQERQDQSNLERRRVIEDSGEADHAMTAADSAPKTHVLTMDEMPHHTFGCSGFGTSGEHTNSVSPYAPTAGSEWLAAEQDTHT